MSTTIDRTAMLKEFLERESMLGTLKARRAELAREQEALLVQIKIGEENLAKAKAAFATTLEGGAFACGGFVYFLHSHWTGILQEVTQLERRPLLPPQKEVLA